jgi:hypothetical protein
LVGAIAWEEKRPASSSRPKTSLGVDVRERVERGQIVDRRHVLEHEADVTGGGGVVSHGREGTDADGRTPSRH